MPETPTIEQTRFRSFAERYLLTRAPHWPVGQETQMAWEATLDAKRFYRLIEQQGKNLNAFIAAEAEARLDAPLTRHFGRGGPPGVPETREE